MQCFQGPIGQETRAFVAQRKEEQARARSGPEWSAVSVVLPFSTSQAITAWQKRSREVQRFDRVQPCLLLYPRSSASLAASSSESSSSFCRSKPSMIFDRLAMVGFSMNCRNGNSIGNVIE